MGLVLWIDSPMHSEGSVHAGSEPCGPEAHPRDLRLRWVSWLVWGPDWLCTASKEEVPRQLHRLDVSVLADTTGVDGIFQREECSFGSYCSTEQGHVVMRLCRSWWVTKLSFLIHIITSCGIRVNVANSAIDAQCGVNESGESGADHPWNGFGKGWRGWGVAVFELKFEIITCRSCLKCMTVKTRMLFIYSHSQPKASAPLTPSWWEWTGLTLWGSPNRRRSILSQQWK